MSKKSVRRERPTRIGYKIVRYDMGVLHSLYDPRIEYVLGKRLTQQALLYHAGGFYAYASPELALNLLLFNTINSINQKGYKCWQCAMISVKLAGRMIEYDGSKIAATYLTPLEILHVYVLTYVGASSYGAPPQWIEIEEKKWKGDPHA
jgi:hypothetical protein